MPLSCSCDFDTDFDWWYIHPNNYSEFRHALGLNKPVMLMRTEAKKQSSKIG